MQITKGCAYCKPILVAAAAEGHNTANNNQASNNSQPLGTLLKTESLEVIVFRTPGDCLIIQNAVESNNNYIKLIQ
jgi:hypothetical protein